ncbi:hypothetical protein BD311DRAFT_274417 [Dichomitus squalens]|uniref:Uncharacterized protein n=1 Tax=Dichomitus squalens TaxID=114155 RepID=A0A4Q9MNF0_9APHY|nr:hypothetical protein BD311DRAFT_274417 [Dichomitus squalens]
MRLLSWSCAELLSCTGYGNLCTASQVDSNGRSKLLSLTLGSGRDLGTWARHMGGQRRADWVGSFVGKLQMRRSKCRFGRNIWNGGMQQGEVVVHKREESRT